MHLHGEELRRLIRYIAVGGMAFLTEFSTFYLLINYLSSTLLLAQSLSFLLGLVISFTGSRYITFSTSADESFHHRAHAQIIAYSALALSNLVLTNVILHFLVDTLGLQTLLAKLAVMAMVVTWNFIIFKKLIFKTTTH